MSDDILQLDSIRKKYSLTSNFISKSLLELDLNLNGYNEDLTEKYFWHLNFAYYTGKGYTPMKLEDHHYFSENSQFGTQMRQIKGGSIRAFQENFTQLIQLIRSHLIPLLNEIKAAEMYKNWFDQITDNDKIVQDLKSKGVSDSDLRLKNARNSRNEAINHLKDKWVNEVDGGKLWQLNRSASEQGLDFALLPQLFFGTGLDDPLNTMKLKAQLDSDIYSIDISYQAKEQIARFMYRFYTWLPTAIADTNVTFKLKLSALKNIYAQIQMNISFMKPLLIEISRKSESFNNQNFYKDYEMENPDFVSLFDFSYSFVKILGVRNFGREQRGSNDLADLDFTKYGLFIKGQEIIQGKYKGKSGFLIGFEGKNHKDVRYIFYPSGDREIDDEKFGKLQEQWNKEESYVGRYDMKSFPIIEYDFSQKRRVELKETQQGPQQVPFMKNKIDYKGYVWNVYEIASYRENLKIDNLKLLETFVEELKIVKDDLLKYINYFPSKDLSSLELERKSSKSNSSSHGSAGDDFSLIFGPFQALGEMFSVLLPSFSFSGLKKPEQTSSNDPNHKLHRKNRVSSAEDVWKVYTVYKKSHQLIQY